MSRVQAVWALVLALLVSVAVAVAAAQQPEHARIRRQDYGTGAAANAGASAAASPDQVAKLLGDIGTQVQKTQVAIQTAAQNWANMFNPNQLANQQQKAPALPLPISRRKRQAGSSSGATDLLAMLADLGPQVERAQSSMKLLSSLFGSGSSGSQGQPLASQSRQLSPSPSQQQPIAWQPQPVSQPQLFNMSPGGQPQPLPQPLAQPSLSPAQLYSGQAVSPQSSGNSASNLMSQLSELIRSTQSNNAKLVASSQQGIQDASQAVAQPVQNAQTGIQGALIEIGQGLKRIALNNPSLIPDIRHLYQSVSSRLSSASSSVAQAANSFAPQKSGPEQLADNLAKEFSVPTQ